MSKPKKTRIIQAPPLVSYFKPQGVPMSTIGRVVLAMEEFEALRLVDRDGLDQAAAAVHLNVSRATCARILESARRKTACAIADGLAIVIEGGDYLFSHNRLVCGVCRHHWETPVQPGYHDQTCPSCGGGEVSALAGQHYSGRHRGRGQHGRNS